MKFASGNAANFWDKQLAHDTEIATGNANRTLGGLSSLADNGLRAASTQAGYGMEAGNAAAGGTVDQASALNTGISSAAKSLSEYFAKRKAEQDAKKNAPLWNPEGGIYDSLVNRGGGYDPYGTSGY
jgi:hypothetical protein